MRTFKDIECVYSYRHKNEELKGGKYKCFVISDKGSISFAVTEVGEQLLINEEVLKKALRENMSVETNGMYMYLDEEGITPLECIVHINIMPLVTNLYVTDTNNSIGISNFNLNRLLNIN